MALGWLSCRESVALLRFGGKLGWTCPFLVSWEGLVSLLATLTMSDHYATPLLPGPNHRTPFLITLLLGKQLHNSKDCLWPSAFTLVFWQVWYTILIWEVLQSVRFWTLQQIFLRASALHLFMLWLPDDALLLKRCKYLCFCSFIFWYLW